MQVYMYCKHCGAEVGDQASVCLKCGVRVGDGSTYCPKCGAKPDPMAIICVKCGYELKKPNKIKAMLNDKNVDPTTFVGAIKHGIQNYAQFKGRATRAEMGWFYLAFGLVSILGCIPILGWPLILVELALICPFLAVTARRLQDTGRPWNYIFFFLIPIASIVFLFIWLLAEGQKGTNEFGPEP